MDRRRFLIETGVKLTGLAAAVSAFEALPVAAAELGSAAPSASARSLVPATRPSVARLRVREAGSYQISGYVRLGAPLVEISGISNSQQLSWTGAAGSEGPLVSFSSFETFTGPGLTPEIQVRGGRLESVSIVPVDYQ